LSFNDRKGILTVHTAIPDSLRTRKPSATFLVGCPRSGTTVLQTKISEHPDVVTFPESHFFDRTLKLKTHLLGRLGLVGVRNWRELERFSIAIEMQEQLSPMKLGILSRYRFIETFIGLLDKAAMNTGSTLWLEKTPGHSTYINQILQHIPEAKFIHIVREPSAVVSSLMRTTRIAPSVWGGEWPMDKCIKRWVSAITDSSPFVNQYENHFFVVYESFIQNHEAWLACIFRFLNLSDQSMNLSAGDTRHILDNETWKSQASLPVSPSIRKDGLITFDIDSISMIEKAIAATEYEWVCRSAERRFSLDFSSF
jgi:hypothetical protein